MCWDKLSDIGRIEMHSVQITCLMVWVVLSIDSYVDINETTIPVLKVLVTEIGNES